MRHDFLEAPQGVNVERVAHTGVRSEKDTMKMTEQVRGVIGLREVLKVYEQLSVAVSVRNSR